MKATEYSKPVPATGFLAKLTGKKDTAYALNIAMGPESAADVEEELSSAKDKLIEWARSRVAKDMVIFTAVASEDICNALKEAVPNLCRQDPELAPLLAGVSIELSLNGKTTTTI